MAIEVLNEGQPYLEDLEFRALLTMFMASDPTPCSQEEDQAIEGLLKHESYVRGYLNPRKNGGDWIYAYHEFQVGENK